MSWLCTFSVVVMYFLAVHTTVGAVCVQVSVHSGNACPVIVNENKLDRLPIFTLHGSCVSHTNRERAAQVHKILFSSHRSG